MSEQLKQTELAFLELVKKMTSYNEAIGVMYWDLRTGAPKKESNNAQKLLECCLLKYLQCLLPLKWKAT